VVENAEIPMSKETIDALRSALEATPDSAPLRVLLAEALDAAGDPQGAAREYDVLLSGDALPRERILAAGRVAARAKAWPLLDRLIDRGARAGMVEGLGELHAARDAGLADQGVRRLVRDASAGPHAAPRAEAEAPALTFTDVGGMADVKKAIARAIVLPFQRPELYARYGRSAGGGVLLYGPPGCGKTMLARAVAGECRVPFVNIRIEKILDPWLGMSERNLHEAFEAARAKRPCVVFLDELDALAYARGKQRSSAARTLVDQLLQELDAIGADNGKLLVLAATNAPWDVDDALKRPGRFDRVLFLPPPDEPARREIVAALLEGRPLESVSAEALARRTPLFSGADLVALVDRAVDGAIDDALEQGGSPPVTNAHFERALAEVKPSTAEWLSRARNYVEFANSGDQYADVARFLKSAEARAVRNR
jgi:transitional endoplasmic reticulum ATPase